MMAAVVLDRVFQFLQAARQLESESQITCSFGELKEMKGFWVEREEECICEGGNESVGRPSDDKLRNDSIL